MSLVTVDLGTRSYPIHIGRDLLRSDGPLAECVASREIMLVTNPTVAPLYLEQARVAAAGARRIESVVLPDGEVYKTLKVLNQVFDALLTGRFGRDAILLALGGGVIGDLTGFAAASYQRGVDYVQLPTTLLAQVDSSVGGKTAVNHELGKNMIGAFHQPIAVIADTATLDTLPDRELSAGLAEVIKYGLICDPVFFDWLESHTEQLLARDATALEHAIRRACEIKAEVVNADEREAGRRALLNLGHTFGHAIESGMGYGGWLHGEAVATGLVMAADLSRRLGWLGAEELERTRRLLRRLALPVMSPATLSARQLRELMAVDKKTKAGKIRLVLLKTIGDAVLTEDIDESKLLATLDDCRASG